MNSKTWDDRFLTLAKQIATWSKDPTTQVGCVIVKKKRIIATGFNGFPVGIPDSPELLCDKHHKRPRMVHAEMNALHFATKSVKNSSIYVTHHPCAACTASLLQHRPERIVIPAGPEFNLSEDWKLSVAISKDMLEKAGVKLDVI